MKKYLCKKNNRQCKVKGCQNTEFFETVYNMCKTHRFERERELRKEKSRSLLQSLCKDLPHKKPINRLSLKYD